MTNKEAIADIRDNIKPVVGGISLDMAIKALEQEPCEDCISRQELDKALYEHFHEEGNPNNITDVRLGAVRNFVKNFPPVIPQSKIGRWIDEPYHKISEYGEEDTYYKRKCSKCFEKYDVVFNYCPNCGADMRGENNDN